MYRKKEQIAHTGMRTEKGSSHIKTYSGKKNIKIFTKKASHIIANELGLHFLFKEQEKKKRKLGLTLVSLNRKPKSIEF